MTNNVGIRMCACFLLNTNFSELSVQKFSTFLYFIAFSFINVFKVFNDLNTSHFQMKYDLFRANLFSIFFNMVLLNKSL